MERYYCTHIFDCEKLTKSERKHNCSTKTINYNEICFLTGKECSYNKTEFQYLINNTLREKVNG